MRNLQVETGKRKCRYEARWWHPPARDRRGVFPALLLEALKRSCHRAVTKALRGRCFCLWIAGGVLILVHRALLQSKRRSTTKPEAVKSGFFRQRGKQAPGRRSVFYQGEQVHLGGGNPNRFRGAGSSVGWRLIANARVPRFVPSTLARHLQLSHRHNSRASSLR